VLHRATPILTRFAQHFVPELNWLVHRLVVASSICFVISNGALLIASASVSGDSSDTDDPVLLIVSDVAVAILILISCVLKMRMFIRLREVYFWCAYLNIISPSLFSPVCRFPSTMH
jgi:hypothetical protein